MYISFVGRYELSERTLQSQVKQKVSGQFKSTQGAFEFAVLRSVIDTMIKNNIGVLNSVGTIVNLHID